MAFTFNLDTHKIERHIQDIVTSIEKGFLDEVPVEIRRILMREVLNRNNWNPAAVYSSKSAQSGKYDLNMSGQLLSTIGDESLNSIIRQGQKVNINIGNIQVLESLRSQRSLWGSTWPSEKSANAPYWRFVVWGHSAPRMNVAFVRRGSVGGKDVGDIVPGVPKMKGTPPTYMFENGWFVAQKEINRVLSAKTNEIVRGLNAKWR